MKNLIKLIFTLSLLLAVFSCKKTAAPGPQATGAINVVNAVVGGSSIAFASTYSVISTNNTVGNNAAAFFPLVGENVLVNLSVPAVAATSTSPAVPAVTYYHQTLSVNSASNYSLFLTGASPTQIDTVLLKENYKRTYADSVCGVRIINLSPGSSPISVNIKGNANGSEVAGLAYKAYSDFKQYPALKINNAYTFEFRDAATGSLVSSYKLVTPYFHNVTLALRGAAGGSQGIILDNDF